jgi:hypothetical protein
MSGLSLRSSLDVLGSLWARVASTCQETDCA